MPKLKQSSKSSDEAPKKKRKVEEADNGPNADTMIKTGFGPARKIKLNGGFAYQWYDAKRALVRIDFAYEASDGGWATLSFGPIQSAAAQMQMMLKMIKSNGEKMLSLAASTDSKAVSVKEHSAPKTNTKSKPAAKEPEEDLEKLFDEKTNPLLRRRK